MNTSLSGTDTRLNDSLATEIRVAMTRRRVSQANLAAALGWTEMYLSRRLTGSVPLNILEAEQIAKRLGVNLIDLIQTASNSVFFRSFPIAA